MKDMEINEKIRYFRKQRGLSQELLAERTGINVNTIRKYEIGIQDSVVLRVTCSEMWWDVMWEMNRTACML